MEIKGSVGGGGGGGGEEGFATEGGSTTAPVTLSDVIINLSGKSSWPLSEARQ